MAAPLSAHQVEASFGVEIRHSYTAATEMPPEVSAAELLQQFEQEGDNEAARALDYAAYEVGQLVTITREVDGEADGLLDIFTGAQVIEMQKRIRDYLGKSLDEHLDDIKAAPGFSYYVGRLATHFFSSDDDVTTRFGDFVTNHIDPEPGARGPLEKNSREYANWANQALITQFNEFYQADFQIELAGPTKTVEGSRVSWERGIAESQFLILDYVRDLLAMGNSSRVTSEGVPTMTIDDLEANLRNLLLEKDRIVAEAKTINPILASQIEGSIEGLQSYTMGVFHRGRMDVPRFRKHPANARLAIVKVEALLFEAAAMAATREDQADIPILDLE